MHTMRALICPMPSVFSYRDKLLELRDEYRKEPLAVNRRSTRAA